MTHGVAAMGSADGLSLTGKATKVEPISLEDDLLDNTRGAAVPRAPGRCAQALRLGRVAVPVVEAVLVGLPRSTTNLAAQAALLAVYSTECFAAAVESRRGGSEVPWSLGLAAGASWVALFCFPGLAALRAARVVGVADYLAESECDGLRRTARVVRQMASNFLVELGTRGHGGLALLLLLLLALYVGGAALHASLGGARDERFAECSTVWRGMFTALRLPVFDDVGLSFFLATASAGRAEAFCICCVLVVVVGFGALSGLIAIFGNAFVVTDAGGDDDGDIGDDGDVEAPTPDDAAAKPDAPPTPAAPTDRPEAASAQQQGPSEFRRSLSSTRNKNLPSTRRAFPGWDILTPRAPGRRSRVRSLDMSPVGRRGRRGSRGPDDGVLAEIASLHAKIDALIAAQSRQPAWDHHHARHDATRGSRLATLPSGRSTAPDPASPDVLEESPVLPIRTMA